MSDDEQDALTWAGDEERGRAGPRMDAAQSARPAHHEQPDDGAPRPTNPLLLVIYGLLAGTYGVFTVGWITTVVRSTTTLPNLPAEILYQLGEFLAIALPALWFVAVLWLERRPPRRLLWLLVGIPVVLPWPWVLGQ